MTGSVAVRSSLQFVVAVVSGKGGTGKTLVASQLARVLAARGRPVTYVDADAEEPNGHLVLNAELQTTKPVLARFSVIDERRCNGCQRCVEVCGFGALLVTRKSVTTLPEHCRACGACQLVCPRGAILEHYRPVGTVASGHAGEVQFLGGTMAIGERRAVPVIEELKAQSRVRSGFVVVDGPPGTACAAVAALCDADLALLVSEPTPFGVHDLRLAADTAAALGVPAMVVLNREGLGGTSLSPVTEPRGLDVVTSIPYQADIARAGALGADPLESSPCLRTALEQLADTIERRWSTIPQGASSHARAHTPEAGLIR